MSGKHSQRLKICIIPSHVQSLTLECEKTRGSTSSERRASSILTMMRVPVVLWTRKNCQYGIVLSLSHATHSQQMTSPNSSGWMRM